MVITRTELSKFDRHCVVFYSDDLSSSLAINIYLVQLLVSSVKSIFSFLISVVLTEC